MNVNWESAIALVKGDGKHNAVRGAHFHAVGEKLVLAFAEIDASARKGAVKEFDTVAAKYGSTIRVADALSVYALTEDGDYGGLRKLAPEPLKALAKQLAGVDRKKWRPVPVTLVVECPDDRSKPVTVPGWKYDERDRAYVYDMRAYLDEIALDDSGKAILNGEGAAVTRLKYLIRQAEAGEFPSEKSIRESIEKHGQEAMAALGEVSPAAQERMESVAKSKAEAKEKQRAKKVRDMAEELGMNVDDSPRVEVTPMHLAALMVTHGDIFAAKTLRALFQSVGMQAFADCLPAEVIAAIVDSTRQADAAAAEQYAASMDGEESRLLAAA